MLKNDTSTEDEKENKNVAIVAKSHALNYGRGCTHKVPTNCVWDAKNDLVHKLKNMENNDDDVQTICTFSEHNQNICKVSKW